MLDDLFCPGKCEAHSCISALNSPPAGEARLSHSHRTVLKTPPRCSGEAPSSQAHCMPSREGSWSRSDGMLVRAGSAQCSCTSCANDSLAIHFLRNDGSLELLWLEPCCPSIVDCSTRCCRGSPGNSLPLCCHLRLHVRRSRSWCATCFLVVAMEVWVGGSNSQNATPKIDPVAVEVGGWKPSSPRIPQKFAGPSSVLCVELFLPVSVNGGGYRVDWGPAKKESVANPAYFVWWVFHPIRCHVQNLLLVYTHCRVTCYHRHIVQ